MGGVKKSGKLMKKAVFSTLKNTIQFVSKQPDTEFKWPRGCSSLKCQKVFSRDKKQALSVVFPICLLSLPELQLKAVIALWPLFEQPVLLNPSFSIIFS